MSSFGFGNTKEGIKEDLHELKGDAKEVKQDVKDATHKMMPIPAFADLGKAANDVCLGPSMGGARECDADV